MPPAIVRAASARWPQPLVAAVALVPACVILGVAFYGFIVWTVTISLTGSRLLPRYVFTGFGNYAGLLDDARFGRSFGNLAMFGVLHVGIALVLGGLLAIALDRLRRGPADGLQLVFLLPLSTSWLVTGLVWQWVLNPGFGLERAVQALGWTGFRFDILVRQETAIYALVTAGVWHVAGLVMALFLAGLRAVDPDIWRAARSEGIPTWRTYLHIVLPTLRTTALTAVLLLSFGVVRMFDLVVAMTGGGPGFATDMPALFIYDMTFSRSRLAIGAASAVMLMVTSLAVLAPYLALELRRPRA